MIRFENVGLRYGVGPEILRDLTFQIGPKSFQFLTGPSGAGKTTISRLLEGHLRERGSKILQPDLADEALWKYPWVPVLISVGLFIAALVVIFVCLFVVINTGPGS